MFNQNQLPKLSEQLFPVSNIDRSKGYIPRYMLHSQKRDSGFFFGIMQFYSHWLCGNNKYFIGKPSGKDGHIIIIGSPGSGKSSCIAIPALESWDGTFVAIDIKKGELLKKSHDMRRPIKVFSFSENEEGHSHYDPMYLLREGNPNDLVQNARELAESIIPIPPKIQDKFWYESAQNVLMATLLYICDLKEEDKETGEIIQGDFNMAISLIQEKTIGELISILSRSKHKTVRKLINQFRNITQPEESKMLQGISAELSRHIMVFATDNRIKTSFTKSDNMIRWEDLETNSIYIEIPEDKLGQWDRAITLMITQLIRTLERRPEKYFAETEAKKIPPVLILLDEFPRLGRIDVITNAVSTLRSKGVTFCLVVQSLSQLSDTYGENAAMTLLENCAYKAILKVTVPQNQKLICDMIGYMNVKKTTFNEGRSVSHGINYSFSIGSKGIDSLSIGGNNGISESAGQSWTEIREPIIYPERLATLNGILLLHPNGFCLIDKVPYYELPKLLRPVITRTLNEPLSAKNKS